MRNLAALHKHWCIADSVNHTVGVEIGGAETSGLSPEALEWAQLHSSFMRLSVWYALLQVVVEGYQELELKDPDIDTFLLREDYMAALRRFRNAMFHYQENPFSDKLLTFLQLDDGEWARGLHRAFKRYFENNLPIYETGVLGDRPHF